jgi:tetratricopeptide (TPR) repeat protein
MWKSKSPVLLLIFSGLSVISGLSFYLLMNKPFGFLFNTSFFAFMISLLLVFLIIAKLCIKSTRRWLKLTSLLPSLIAIVLFLATIIVIVDVRIFYFAGLPPSPTKEEWIQDLHFLAEQMQTKYPNLYSRVSEEKFNQTVKEMEERIPQLSESDIVMELFRLTALPKDGHTIPFLPMPCFDMHDLPLKFYKFNDGWFIIDAARAYSNLTGTKLLSIEKTPIDSIYQKYSAYLATENEFAQLDRFTYIGLMPEWLKSQKIIDNLNEVNLTVEKPGGEQITEKINSVNFIYKLYWSFINPIENKAPVAFLNTRKDSYWFQVLEESKSIYFQFNDVSNQSGKETIAQFAKRMEEYVNSHDFDRFIIDLRNNMGGQDVLLNSLLKVIRDNKKINQHNKLFVLTGRRTFSSAVMFAYKLKLQTNAIFIGEPTGQGPVFIGDPNFVTLPNSKLVFAIATKSIANIQADWSFPTGKKISPDVAVPYNHNDFLIGKDPVLEKAQSVKLPDYKSITVSDSVLNQYVGRYLLSPLQIVDVKLTDSKLTVIIDDFVARSIFRVQTRLFAKTESDFETGISNVSISFSKDSIGKYSSLILNWEGLEKKITRAPEGFKTAMELIVEGRYDPVKTMISANKPFYSKLSFFEDALNTVGYQLLNQNKNQEAIDIFQLCVELYPASANAFDSLGEAYLKDGKNELAIVNYKKSLELNPSNENAKKILKQIKN